MLLAFSGRVSAESPFALNPGEDAAQAIGPGLAHIQAAWPFIPIIPGDLDEFIDRWAGWFGDAAQGQLSQPNSMPERPFRGSWRQH